MANNAQPCAVASCQQPAKLYDERAEVYVCDTACLADYIADDLDGFTQWYAGLYVHRTE